MKLLSLLLLLTIGAVALISSLRPHVASAQLEATPILGEPVIVTPLASSIAAPELDPTEALVPTRTSVAVPSRAAAEPDACEPNNTPAQACAIPLDTVSGPFTIVPEADQDFFRLDLPQEASIQTIVTVRATEGLDLALSVRQGTTVLASDTFSLTLDPGVAGTVVLRVENRDPRPAVGEQYRVEVRREIVPPRAEGREAPNGLAPDALENNWSFETASGIAVGVVYDLSFACPDPRPNACPGGDHDYLLVPVKAGVPYLITTFELDPGVDTVVELFWGATTTAIAGNDDYAPGGPLSTLEWTASADGLLGIRIAPRNGGLPQHLGVTKASYRFAVAPLASELARKLQATIRQQANVPTPTSTVAAAPSSAGSPATSGGGSAAGGSTSSTASGAAVQESIAAGQAIIINETVLRREPSERATALATLAPETGVTVRGPVSGLWVSVETAASILPGWVRWSDLQRVAEAMSSTAASQNGAGAMPTSQQPGAATTALAAATTSTPGAAGGVQPAARQVVVNALDPALPPPPVPPVARVPFTLAIVIAATDRPPTGGSAFGLATPTPDLRQPVAQVRVQLVNVFGDLLAEGLTDDQGAMLLRRDVRPGDALAVRIPAWGVERSLAADQTRLIVTIPEAQQ